MVQSLPLAKPSAIPSKLQIQRHLRLFVSIYWEDLQFVFFRKMKCQFHHLDSNSEGEKKKFNLFMYNRVAVLQLWKVSWDIGHERSY